MHMPPPVHGAAVVGKYIHDSRLVNEAFECHYINLALAKDLTDIGKAGVSKLLAFGKLLKEIRQQVKTIKPDLCYVTPNAKGGAFYKDYIVVQMLKRVGCKVIVHYHNKGVSTRQNRCLDNWLYKRFFKDLKVILLAESLYPDISKYAKRKDVFICPNGIPQSPVTLDSQKHDGFNILFLSNMMAEKGVWTLIDACRILKDRGKHFHCDFVGKWSDISHNDFNDKVKEKGLGGFVKAHGAQYGDEKDKFWQQTDLFVFPTYYHNEAFSLVLLEAMQNNIACISTNEGGIPDIIENGATGFIVNKKDPETLADKIAYCIDHPNECKEMGEEGRQRFLDDFTLGQFEKNIVDILKENI